jgi:hypothetical protein
MNNGADVFVSPPEEISIREIKVKLTDLDYSKPAGNQPYT